MGQIEVSPYLIAMSGYIDVEFLGKALWMVVPSTDTVANNDVFEEPQTTGYVGSKDLPSRPKTGALLAVEFVNNRDDRKGIKIIRCNIREILRFR